MEADRGVVVGGSTFAVARRPIGLRPMVQRRGVAWFKHHCLIKIEDCAICVMQFEISEIAAQMPRTHGPGREFQGPRINQFGRARRFLARRA